MNYRIFGKTGFKVSEVSLGTWQLGSRWGDPFDGKVALDTLEAAFQNGINLFDTADIYQDGCSERAIGKFLRQHPDDRIYVVTKMGRALNPHVAEGYNEANLRRFVDQSRQQLGMDSLDVTLLHCPPTPVFSNRKVFEVLDSLKAEGKIKHYGVSIERIDEGLAALEHDISAIEVIFNMFRLRPADELFKKAAAKGVAIIVRVPRASGLLTGRFTADTQFGPDDHRTFNRNGEAFDKGETFSGVDYMTGVRVAQQLKEELGTDDLATTALRYILMYPEVSVVIPGASRPEQIQRNVKASDAAPLTDGQMQTVRDIYNKEISPLVHHLW